MRKRSNSNSTFVAIASPKRLKKAFQSVHEKKNHSNVTFVSTAAQKEKFPETS